MRLVRGLLALLAALLVLAGAGTARADNVDDLVRQLETSKDFRVRTQAALALGASKTSRAVTPLCSGLDDKSSTVRAASAAALGKLQKGGADCLKARLAVEEQDAVKKLIAKALAKLAGAQAPVITDAHKYYVVLETNDKTGREESAVSRLVHKGAKTAVLALPQFVIAPRGQSDDEAKELLAQHQQLKAVMLSTTVTSTFAAGTLTVKLEVAIFTFPDKNLRGTFSKTLSMSGLAAKSSAAEDELIQTAAERVIKTFSEQASKIP